MSWIILCFAKNLVADGKDTPEVPLLRGKIQASLPKVVERGVSHKTQSLQAVTPNVQYFGYLNLNLRRSRKTVSMFIT
jgi:hypothetical protein